MTVKFYKMYLPWKDSNFSTVQVPLQNLIKHCYILQLCHAKIKQGTPVKFLSCGSQKTWFSLCLIYENLLKNINFGFTQIHQMCVSTVLPRALPKYRIPFASSHRAIKVVGLNPTKVIELKWFIEKNVIVARGRIETIFTDKNILQIYACLWFCFQRSWERTEYTVQL